jgi:hypothetical protein
MTLRRDTAGNVVEDNLSPITPGATVVRSFDDASKVTAATFTGIVRLMAMGADCHIAIGDAPVATTADMPLQDGAEYYFRIDGKVAVIRAAGANGNLFITGV